MDTPVTGFHVTVPSTVPVLVGVSQFTAKPVGEAGRTGAGAGAGAVGAVLVIVAAGEHPDTSIASYDTGNDPLYSAEHPLLLQAIRKTSNIVGLLEFDDLGAVNVTEVAVTCCCGAVNTLVST